MPSELEAQANRAQVSRVLALMADQLELTPAQLAEGLHVPERVIKLAGQGDWDKISDHEETALMQELRAYEFDVRQLETPFERWAREHPNEVAEWLKK